MAVPWNYRAASPITLIWNQPFSQKLGERRRGAKCVAASHLSASGDLLSCFQRLAGSVKQLHTCEAATHWLSALMRLPVPTWKIQAGVTCGLDYAETVRFMTTCGNWLMA